MAGQSVDGFAGAGARAGAGVAFLLSGPEDDPEPFDVFGSDGVCSLVGLVGEPLSLDSEPLELESSDPASPVSDFLPPPPRLSVL